MGSQPELAKLYYRIGEVAQIVGVQPHVLRYWESEFRTIRPRKSTKGQRVYSRRDVEKLLRVKDLLKNQGFTIAGAKKQLRDLVAPGAPSATAAGPVSEPMQTIASSQPVPTVASILATPTLTPASAMPAPAMPVVQPLVPSLTPFALPTHAPAPPPPPPRPESRIQVRQALVALREDVLRMLDELAKG